MGIDMNNRKPVIAAASSYSQKFYFNPDYFHLPLEVQRRIKVILVSFAEEIGGDISLEMEGNELVFKTAALENDIYYDEIGAGLKIKEIKKENAELMLQLEIYAKWKSGLFQTKEELTMKKEET